MGIMGKGSLGKNNIDIIFGHNYLDPYTQAVQA